MRKTKFAVILFALLLLLPGIAYGSPPEISAETAILMDADTGQILYDKEMHKQMYPASITKILTTILAVENLDLEVKIVMSAEAVDAVSRDASHIALTEGEEITVAEAVYAALLASANDACNGIAEAVSGSMNRFAEFMTGRAKEMGCLNTNFTNSNGLKDENHYTSAFDMAKITQYGLKIDSWREMFGCRRYEMPPNNKQEEIRYLNNQHKMIFEKKDYYEGIVGGKTGYTTVAKNTLVTVAERDGRELIVVVMKCPRSANTYEDTRALLDYGFEQFNKTTIAPDDLPKTTEDGTEFYLDEPVQVLIPADVSNITKEIRETESGDAMFLLTENGETISQIPVEITKKQVVNEEQLEEEENVSFLGVLFIILVVILVLFAILIAFLYVRSKIYRNRRQKAARRRKIR